MNDTRPVAPAPRISTIVSQFLVKRGRDGAIAITQNLRDAGFSSTDLVNLMLAVEAEFDIFVPEDQMTPENFSTIRAIDRLVTSLIQA